ncbi:DUF4416 family protein [Thermospira aquatica]|uniref:DUF4416 family protein n=1 Tax=Thermospira aquatica TaxID=2828656 RepID=A0AAX3BCQ8_9SPIR|nr:DUF4416 family protein [Thermospira aquatica]URA09985.1 DUF4416 family protein [Thermospira aquatica]
MGKPFEHEPVKLVIGVLFSDEKRYLLARERVCSLYGVLDYESPPFEFSFTHYYDEEMGVPIFRVFLSFEKLIQPEEIVEIKLQTNNIEEELAVEGKRLVNLDPGYMQLGKFILATTKDQMHRIYLARGIYAEVTLHYHKKNWQSWPWTYPDYASDDYKRILKEIREIYYKQLKAIGGNIPRHTEK